jgi:outer membrane lipoprotein-sorting protein
LSSGLGEWTRCAAALLLAAGIGGAAAAAIDDGATVDDLGRIEAYLNDIDTMKARFVQVAADGRVSEGTLHLDRPSRMRLDYDPPRPIMLLAAHGRVVYWDPRLEQVSYIPIGRTPLGVLLQDEIRMDGDIEVLDLERIGDELHLAVASADGREQGYVILVFTESPLMLRSWTVVDAQGLPTQVELEDIETGMPIDRDLFVFRDPTIFPGLRDR